MRILIAEDENEIALQYKSALEKRGHKVTVANDGETCLEIYRRKCEESNKLNSEQAPAKSQTVPPFDVVVLDYRMPRKDGMDVAKEVLNLEPRQRIIFASAYVKETLEDSVKQLKQVVELMQKPFRLSALVDTIEDVEIYKELASLNFNVKELKNWNPTHDQIRDLLEGLRKVMKGRTF